MTIPTPVRIAAIFLGLSIFVGCGGVADGKSISGRVTFKDQPLVCGTVTLFFPDNVVLEGGISPDGTYLIPKGRPGKPKITVVSEKPVPSSGGGERGAAAKAGPTADPAKWVAIPDKYSKLETTPLELTVSSTLDIKLEP